MNQTIEAYFEQLDSFFQNLSTLIARVKKSESFDPNSFAHMTIFYYLMYPIMYIILSGASPIVNIVVPLLLLAFYLDPTLFIREQNLPSKGLSYAITEMWAFEQLLWFQNDYF